MKAEDVARFLHGHPGFFDQHPDLLESIQVPHPYGGRAIPLAERQALALREKARALEGRLGELVRLGQDNDAISERVHRLAVALVGARDFPSLTRSLYLHLREDFSIPHVALRVWGKAVPVDFAEAAPPTGEQRRGAETLAGPQCVQGEGNLYAAWFGEAGPRLRSMALLPLGESPVFGLLALGSEDAQRFYPGMGTLYLRRVAELCAAGVSARL